MDPTESAELEELAPAPDDPSLKYLHPSSLIFDLLSNVRSYLLPLIFGLFGAANGNVRVLIISAVLFLPAVIRSILRYFTLKYHIRDAHLVVEQGLVSRKTRTIPVDRIQNIDLTQNVLHRIFHVAEVRIETASGTEAEATLRVLSLQQLEVLRQSIFRHQSRTSVSASPETSLATTGKLDTQLPIPLDENSVLTPAASLDSPRQLIWKIPLSDLVRAGLASNRGLVLLFILYGTSLQFAENSLESFYDFVSEIFPRNDGSAAYYLLVAAAAILTLLLLRLAGIAWYVLRFYGYQLSQLADDLQITCGLFTKVSATVPRDRIQFISVQQNLIMRWLEIATIRIETAGGAGDQSKPSESVSRSWFLPVLPLSKVPLIVEKLRPGFAWEEQRSDLHGLSERAGRRFVRLAIGQSILAAALGVYFYPPWGWSAGLIVLPVAVVWAKQKATSRKYARGENSVLFRSGVLTKKTSVTFHEKIQIVTCEQTPFDRRWAMATLAIDTAAAGQAGHRIRIQYLDNEFAQAEVDFLRHAIVDPGNC